MWWWVAAGILLLLVWVGINVSVLRSGPASERDESSGTTVAKTPPTVPSSAEPDGPAGARAAEPEPTVLDVKGGSPSPGVFQSRRERFVWYRGRATVLAEDRWRPLFEWLCDAPEVLGWMAFEGDQLAAGDRSYDDGLVSVLREHRRSVERVRREVGLTDVREWVIVGSEGTVGVVAAPEDIWLAVFVEPDTDVNELGSRLSAYLQAPERTV